MKMWEENQKIINVVHEKTFQLGPRTGKEKLNINDKKKNLFKTRCCLVFSKIKLQIVKLPI